MLVRVWGLTWVAVRLRRRGAVAAITALLRGRRVVIAVGRYLWRGSTIAIALLRRRSTVAVTALLRVWLW